MKFLIPILKPLFFGLLGLLPALVFAQVNAIGTGFSELVDMDTTNNYTTNSTIAIPTANSRLLVVTLLTNNGTNMVNSVVFNETGSTAKAMTLSNTGTDNTINHSIYYLVLNGKNATSGTITATTISNSRFGFFVHAFENVDPNSPIDISSQSFTSGSSPIMVPSQENDMLVDLRFSSGSGLNLGAGQTDLGPAIFNNQMRSTFKNAEAGNTTTMSNNLSAGHLITGLNYGPPEINIPGITNSTTVNFGETDFRGTTVHRTFTIENLGHSDLQLPNSVQIGGINPTDFSVITAPTSPIPPNGSTTFTIAFSPTTSGQKTATITIANNDLDENPIMFTVQGQGVKIIPTMSQWGLIIFSLFLVNLGVLLILRRRYI
jgi:hypothetical protein